MHRPQFRRNRRRNGSSRRIYNQFDDAYLSCPAPQENKLYFKWNHKQVTYDIPTTYNPEMFKDITLEQLTTITDDCKKVKNFNVHSEILKMPTSICILQCSPIFLFPVIQIILAATSKFSLQPYFIIPLFVFVCLFTWGAGTIHHSQVKKKLGIRTADIDFIIKKWNEEIMVQKNCNIALGPFGAYIIFTNQDVPNVLLQNADMNPIAYGVIGQGLNQPPPPIFPGHLGISQNPEQIPMKETGIAQPYLPPFYNTPDLANAVAQGIYQVNIEKIIIQNNEKIDQPTEVKNLIDIDDVHISQQLNDQASNNKKILQHKEEKKNMKIMEVDENNIEITDSFNFNSGDNSMDEGKNQGFSNSQNPLSNPLGSLKPGYGTKDKVYAGDNI